MSTQQQQQQVQQTQQQSTSTVPKYAQAARLQNASKGQQISTETTTEQFDKILSKSNVTIDNINEKPNI